MHVDRYLSFWIWLIVVFTKCAENLENGRRLENFSWRLWYREAHFFEDSATLPASAIPFVPKSTAPQPIPSPPEVLSDLSESVNSASDLDDVHHVVDRPHDHEESPGPARPCLESSPRRQSIKHLSPDSFKYLIESLEPPDAEAEKWKALKVQREIDENIAAETLASTTTHASEPAPPPPAMPTDIPAPRSRTLSETQGSPNTASGRSLQRVSSSIVHGFTPENPSISRRLTPLEPAIVDPPVIEQRIKPRFFIASSSVSDSDEEYAPLSLKSSIKPTSKSSKSTLSPPGMKRAASNGSVKKTHFHEIVDTKILSAPPTEDSEDEDEDSAVMSDDEDEEWEDSQSEGEGVNEDDHLFDKRQDTQLTSRPSMLSTLFKSKSDFNLPSQAFRASNTFVRSRTSPSHTPRPPLSPPTDPLHIPSQLGLGASDQFSQPIPASPRTTRRRMLASELSESLRRNLLWERQHRTMTNNVAAAIKRRHTSNDLARLKEYPEVPGSGEPTRPGDGKNAFDSGDAVW
jgi:hypothetical protein